MDEKIKRFMEEGYKRFPDEVEPVDYHPAGRIVTSRGDLRYAFLEGALFAALTNPTAHPEIDTGAAVGNEFPNGDGKYG